MAGIKIATGELMKGDKITKNTVNKRIKKLENMLFERGAMTDPPCFCCGYNGPGYYNSDIHKCAKRHHRLCKS
jgi:hypothetical protein